MWKKSEDPQPSAAGAASPSTAAQRRGGGNAVAMIGPSIRIKGDLTGQEDLLVQGRVEGEISLRQNNVTIGENGRVKADVHGKSIRVDGEVKGNLYGSEEIVIRASGRVQGNLVSPRVSLENGSKFKGNIDMEAASLKAAAPPAEPKRPTVKAPDKAPQRPAQPTADPRPAQT